MEILKKQTSQIEKIAVADIVCDLCDSSLRFECEGLELKGDIFGHDLEDEENYYIPIKAHICAKCFKEKLLPLFPNGIKHDWNLAENKDHILSTNFISEEDFNPPIFIPERKEENSDPSFEPLEKDKIKFNGGEKCDMKIGPCSCGAWHKKEK